MARNSTERWSWVTRMIWSRGDTHAFPAQQVMSGRHHETLAASSKWYYAGLGMVCVYAVTPVYSHLCFSRLVVTTKSPFHGAMELGDKYDLESRGYARFFCTPSHEQETAKLWQHLQSGIMLSLWMACLGVYSCVQSFVFFLALL